MFQPLKSIRIKGSKRNVFFKNKNQKRWMIKHAKLSFAKSHLMPGVSRLSDIVFDYAKGWYFLFYSSFFYVFIHFNLGSYIYDVDGKKYLDFISGIAVNSTGKILLIRSIKDEKKNWW